MPQKTLTPTERFLNRKPVREVLGTSFCPTPEITQAIDEWFEVYPNSHADWNWLKQIAIWISLDLNDYVDRRRRLDTMGRSRHSAETFSIRYGVDGPRLFEEWKSKPKHGTPINRFLKSAETKRVLGSDYAPCEKAAEALERWFGLYPDCRKGRDWFSQLATWLSLGFFDLLERRSRLETIGIYRNSLEAFIIRYGEDRGTHEHAQWSEARREAGPNTIPYWIARGYDPKAAQAAVNNHQKLANQKSVEKRRREGTRNFSHRCPEFWISKGMTPEAAASKISDLQRRGLQFYIKKYGIDEGVRRHNAVVLKRRATWSQKDTSIHASKTLHRTYNPNGMEAKAVRMFIDQNNLGSMKCVFGAPNEQFSVDIPGIGLRRYDLAIFDTDESLKIIFEFHGPAHINFSQYDESIRDELVWDERGKTLPYGVTFGEVYNTDRAKREYIVENFPKALYLVGWVHDFRKKDFRIGTLLRRYADRVSEAVL